MRNVIFVTKLNKAVQKKCFVDIDKIVGVGYPTNGVCRLYFDNAIWEVPDSEYEYIMHAWAPYYTELEEYNNFINNG